MFLSVTLKRNPALIEAAVNLHRKGAIPPETYVLDLDAIAYNARLLARAADRAGIRLYMMTKQIGRNPEVARLIAANGIRRAVAVDMTPPFDWTMWKAPAKASPSSACSSLAR